jgi:hypothetical protein
VTEALRVINQAHPGRLDAPQPGGSQRSRQVGELLRYEWESLCIHLPRLVGLGIVYRLAATSPLHPANRLPVLVVFVDGEGNLAAAQQRPAMPR